MYACTYVQVSAHAQSNQLCLSCTCNLCYYVRQPAACTLSSSATADNMHSSNCGAEAQCRACVRRCPAQEPWLQLLAHLLQLPHFICTLAVLPLKPMRLILVHCTPVDSLQQLLSLLLKLVCKESSTQIKSGEVIAVCILCLSKQHVSVYMGKLAYCSAEHSAVAVSACTIQMLRVTRAACCMARTYAGLIMCQ
jgi:hypothetical protein